MGDHLLAEPPGAGEQGPEAGRKGPAAGAWRSAGLAAGPVEPVDPFTWRVIIVWCPPGLPMAPPAGAPVGSGATLAQLVEHVTENHGVPSSILGFGTTSGSGSVVEHLLAKERVASSNLVFRSFLRMADSRWHMALQINARPQSRGRYQLFAQGRRSQVAKAGVCKTPIAGSNPAVASKSAIPRRRG